MKAYQDKITKDQFFIISADTEHSQLQALKQGLATENLGQKPFEMGIKSTEMMYNYLMFIEKPIKRDLT
ncbi:hypothetical protein CWB72_19385 [Pseudoalteromonas phenolica]|uniref:hypothetical protein n=1 Tax=Pseudoalteromonas phenolica TaxID=161398 RepID=UPI00110AAF42|nr:hypothetical protein [Pseudoalteromonas phenolica]TMN86560.1 hypothetical protein CWB72_19385 [Pseudoalteromonas phenolica]